MNSIFFYWMLIFVMVVWMAIKVGRSSTGMGVVTFLFWPIAIIPLITNWGQRDSDIRLQFLVAAIASVLLWNSLGEAELQTQRMLQEDELALIGSEDSIYAMQIERERDGGSAAAGTLRISDGAAVTGAGGSSMASSAAPDVQFAPALAKVHSTPLHEIRFRRGVVRLPSAFASIDVPAHFRFVARHQLGLLSELRDIPVAEQTQGWIVHERVNLNSADFWFVEVAFHEVGYLAPPSPEASGSALQWDAATATATWGQPAVPVARGTDQSAVKLIRHGAIRFRVPELKDDQLELGLRAVRLMASRTLPEPGWAHAEYIGEGSPLALAQWVESLQAASEPKVVAERDDDQHSG